MYKFVLIGAGGCMGALARYLVSGFAQRWTVGMFPVGTLLVNISGCLAIGIIMGLIEDKGVLGVNTRMFLGVGFIGSFTTFSTMGYETVEILNRGQMVSALWNVAGNFGLGIGAVVLGRFLVRAMMA